ncbi:MAG: cation-translocating P-type ATPase [Clostridia bacterium]|nr:cation-translocating P-type ATPase [Clostridia bacterium]
MIWYCKNTGELFKELGSSVNGISEAEAKARFMRDGANELGAAKKKSFARRFFGALCDRMTAVLLAAAAVSFATSLIGGGGLADPVIILVIVLANAFIAAVQESRAERALEALKKLSAPEITVLRGGKERRISAKEAVRGDVFLLEKGDIIPCDAKLISCNELITDESALTGESEGVLKDARFETPDGAPLSEAKSAVFTSTAVISGRGRALAVKTGRDTCVGEIADMISGENGLTPLQKRLARLSALLGNATIAICVLIFLFSLLKGMNAGEMFMTSVSLSVAAIPEGLPAIVTVVLSAGVQTLARRKAIVKRLPAVETLGCTQVICTDKTGTLTCNRMAVAETEGDKAALRRAFALCNNGASPTERALLDCVPEYEEIREKYPRTAEIPFDSDKKYMLTVHRNGAGFLVLLKGAPYAVASRCPGDEERINSAAKRMAEKALRVMCFAGYECAAAPADPLNARFDYYGLCGISDPPRPEAKNAVALCKKAGIRPVMITGDHPATARAVAVQTGIIPPGGRVCTEAELNALDSRGFARAVRECGVFARVTPKCKLKIVEALKKAGNVVAMTGDGVNDAPALKKADIGCAMGISGTEVAKESADMVLADDNFATVVEAVREGRGIYENIRRAVHFLLSCNFGELFTVFGALLLSLPSPLSAIQLLWVNLTTDSLPAIALGLEKTPESVMERPPVKPDSPLFTAKRSARIVLEGLLIGGLAITAFLLGCRRGFEAGRTMCFTVLSVSQLFHSFNLRSEKSVFSRRKKRNPYVYAAFAVCLAMQLSALLIPSLSALFGVAAMTPDEWAWCAGLSAAPLAAGEIHKLFTHYS